MNNSDFHKPFFAVYKITNYCKTMEEEALSVHQHNYYSIYWIQSGEALYTTTFVNHSLFQDYILFVPPDLPHKIVLSENSSGICILFNKSYLYNKSMAESFILHSVMFNNPDFYTIINIETDEISKFKILTEYLEKEFDSENQYQQDIIIHLLNIFLTEAKRIFDKQYSDKISKNENNTFIIQFKKQIEENFKNNKETSFYADKLNMAVSCLNENTKKITGITAGELIRNRIIEEAKKLLLTTEMNAKEIAYNLGFDDPAYFSRFFKKYTGSTLLEFRNILQGKVQ